MDAQRVTQEGREGVINGKVLLLLIGKGRMANVQWRLRFPPAVLGIKDLAKSLQFGKSTISAEYRVGLNWLNNLTLISVYVCVCLTSTFIYVLFFDVTACVLNQNLKTSSSSVTPKRRGRYLRSQSAKKSLSRKLDIQRTHQLKSKVRQLSLYYLKVTGIYQNTFIR